MSESVWTLADGLERPVIAFTLGLDPPVDLRPTFVLRGVGPRVVQLEADLLLTTPTTYYAWARANPHLPTVALRGARVEALGFLRGHIVPPESPSADDLSEFLLGVVRASSALSSKVAPPRARFTRRERQVVDHLLRGASVAQAASQLGIAESTARQYLQNVRHKLDAPNITLALLKAAQYGLIDWPPLPVVD